MFENALAGLLAAWLLSLVGFDQMVIRCVKDLTGKEVSAATYYVGAFFFGYFVVSFFN